MTLEDFFTLTEMKEGLSNLSRIEELLSVIENVKEFGTSNGGDAIRQCSTVARTLAVTENDECLNNFVQLNGLFFLNKWLQEALSLNTDIGGNVVEELINALLASFERLPIDCKRATASGIAVTVKHLLGHQCLQIKDKARILYDKWNCSRDDTPDLEKSEMTQNDQPKPLEEAKTVDVSPCQEEIGKGTSDLESAGTESYPAMSSLPDAMNNKEVPPSNQILPLTSPNSVTANAVLGDGNSSGASLITNCCQDNSSVFEQSSVCAASGFTPIGVCSSQCTREGNVDNQLEVPLSKDAPNSLKESEMDMMEDKLCNSNQRDFGNSTLSAPEAMQVTEAESNMSGLLDSRNTDMCALTAIEPQARLGVVDCHMLECSTSTKEKEVEQDTKGFQYSFGSGSILSSSDVPKSSYQRIEAVRTSGRTKDLGETEAKINKVDILTFSGSLRVVETKASEEKDQKTELGLIDDALEVARQVAIAVEREVVHYREPFCSSPDVNSGEANGACSPDSEDAKQDDPVIGEAGRNSSLAGSEDHSGSDSSSKETSEITQNISSDSEKSDQDSGLQKMEISAHESVGKSDIDRCNLDLNEDICNEEMECSTKPMSDMQVNVSTPVAIVASSKGVSALPSIPLHFKGELGWKGSAATSAFRPASPRRVPNGEKAFSAIKHKSSFLEIDLNVASCEDEVFVEPTSVKQLPASSSLPSGDSSMEVSSRKAEMLKLDLNRLSDEDASAYPSSHRKLRHQNGEQTLSSASSSSARQPSMRDFDLNDNPSFLDVGCSHNFEKSSPKAFDTCGGSKLDDPITIMGSKFSLERKDIAYPVQPSFLPNGLNMEPMSVARPLLPYAHMQPAAYGYSALPNGPTVSIPQAFYSPGSFPYMVDSRGTTVFPQVIGSGYNGGPSARPPFLMNVTSTPPTSSGLGSFRPGFDLNSGITLIDGGNKDGGSLRQFFLQGHSGLMEEQRQAMQPPSSGITSKRKEPEGSWEHYPYGYKHMTSWQ